METRVSHSDHPEYGIKSCTDSRDRLYIKDTPAGQVWFCHDCQARGFIPARGRSPTQTAQLVKQYLTDTNDIEIFQNKIQLPNDFTNIIPQVAQFWLKKYEITDEEIKTYNFGWSDYQKRLILPVYSARAEGTPSELIYYQGRTLSPITKDNAKYMNIKQSGAKNVFFTRGFNQSTPVDKLYIVEDILSCIKVGRYQPCLALLGSYFPTDLNPLYRLAKKIYIWLDEDKYLTAVKQAKVINMLTGIPVTICKTELDPKEIKERDLCVLCTQ